MNGHIHTIPKVLFFLSREESKDKRVGTSPLTSSQKMSNSGRVLKGRGFMVTSLILLRYFLSY